MIAFAALAFMHGHAAELPPEVQADRFLVKAELQFQAGNSIAAVATLDKIVALQRDHGLEMPPAFWFKHAQACLDAGFFQKAADSALKYVTEAGREGRHYREALQVLAAAELALKSASEPESFRVYWCYASKHRESRGEFNSGKRGRELTDVGWVLPNAPLATPPHQKELLTDHLMTKHRVTIDSIRCFDREISKSSYYAIVSWTGYRLGSEFTNDRHDDDSCTGYWGYDVCVAVTMYGFGVGTHRRQAERDAVSYLNQRGVNTAELGYSLARILHQCS